MGQTFGSQVFGSWYDVIGWGIGSAIFVLLALRVDSLTPKTKETLPAFLQDKKTNFILAAVFALAAIAKALRWW